MHCQRRPQISRVMNTSSVFEVNSVTCRLAPPYGGLLLSLLVASAVAFGSVAITLENRKPGIEITHYNVNS